MIDPAPRSARKVSPAAGRRTAAAPGPGAGPGFAGVSRAGAATPQARPGTPAPMELRRMPAAGAPGADRPGEAEVPDIQTIRRTVRRPERPAPAEHTALQPAAGRPVQITREVQEAEFSAEQVRNLADRVYRQIEARLRSEKMRRGL